MIKLANSVTYKTLIPILNQISKAKSNWPLRTGKSDISGSSDRRIENLFAFSNSITQNFLF